MKSSVSDVYQDIHISEIGNEQLDKVSALAHKIWPICFKDILTTEQISNMLEQIYSPENLRLDQAKGHIFWLVSNNQKPLGYASAYQEENAIWLKKLYLLPDSQGKGVGRMLIQTIINAFRPASHQCF